MANGRNNIDYEVAHMRKIAHMMVASKGNYETFNSMKCMNAGKTVVLCGAGPTLKDYKPLEGVLHVALNRALLYEKVKFDWFIADDWEGIDFMQKEIIEYDCVKFLGRFSDALTTVAIPQSFGNKCGAKWFYTDLFLTENGFDGRFVCDIDKMPIGAMPNIALEALEILLFTYPKRIYLVGCDASKGHFKNVDLGEDRNEKLSQETEVCVAGDRIIEKWKSFKRFVEIYYPDVEIVSINPVGLKGLFEDVYQ